MIIVTLILTLFTTAVDAQQAAKDNACINCHTAVGATKGILNDWSMSKHKLCKK